MYLTLHSSEIGVVVVDYGLLKVLEKLFLCVQRLQMLGASSHLLNYDVPYKSCFFIPLIDSTGSFNALQINNVSIGVLAVVYNCTAKPSRDSKIFTCFSNSEKNNTCERPK
jgi:hypothetical protein